MRIYTYNLAEEAEFESLMRQARKDARTFGISHRFKAYLEQFAPTERMLHILAMFAEVENQFEVCHRLLCSELDATQEERNRSN
jgi:hypothetical protein